MFKSYTLKQARHDLPKRLRRDNKTRGGKCLIIAGSPGMWGAAVLCASAAARTGAGYTYILDFSKTFPTVKHPDFLIQKGRPKFGDFSAIAIGPGLKNSLPLRRLMTSLIVSRHPAVVIDAGALDSISQMKTKIPKTWILTPHEGELARMLGISSHAVRTDRKRAVIEAQKKFGGIIVLKGFQTLVASEAACFKIQAGNPALAKGGTGDVLTGMIAAFRSQGLEPMPAAALGVTIHGEIAAQWIREGNDVLSLMASDLVARLPVTIADLRRGEFMGIRRGARILG